MTSEIIICPNCRLEKELYYNTQDDVVHQTKCKCYRFFNIDEALDTLGGMYAKDLPSNNQVSVSAKTDK